MNDKQSLSHTVWDCKYHVVWIPKCRRKVLYGQLRKYLGQVLRELAMQKECKVVEGHLMGDHVHMLISIPPKYGGHRKNFVGQNFWARGYYVSTAGRDEEMVREYIRRQEEEDRKLDQLNIFE